VDELLSLEREWRAIETSDRVSFFQSWDWIGSLLESLPRIALPHVVRVYYGSRVIGVGLIGYGIERRRGVIRSRTLHLNETGVPAYDRVTLEHNGLATLEGFESIGVQAVIDEFARRGDWDEFHLRGLTVQSQGDWARAARAGQLWSSTRWEEPFYYIDLDQQRGTTYLEGLSANTRYQIRRAIKMYASRGALTLRYSSSVNEAHDWLQRLIELHQTYWRGKGYPGAFETPFTRRFHATVIQRGWSRGTVELAKVSAGESVVGYLYNFRKGSTLYSYQTGFIYEDDPKLKPGLVCHALAAEEALQRGLSKYDLLMGGSQYKKSLANAVGSMVWQVAQKQRLLIGLENRLLSARKRWRGLWT
jgi:CelD/BcsL family acetyltransferase involved in cellulose biosynthesis